MPVTLFSASSLQDYAVCPRRFQLRYVLGLTWPAPETAQPAEQEEHIWLGRELHRLIHQHLLGIPVERLSPMVQHPALERWWQAYLAFVPHLHAMRVLPEITLSTPLARQRLIARFDAIAVADQPDTSGVHAIILDWKTYRHRPSREWLAARLQSRVYPVVFLRAGAAMMEAGAPSDVEMWYWFAEHPLNPERLRYSAAAYRADIAYLEALVAEIAQRIAAMASTDIAGEVWSLTEDERECRYCTYRSLCRRSVAAGPEEYMPDDATLHDEPPYEVGWEPEGLQTTEMLF
ncbi:MAG: PD-(D/E)XK nuclease family protein [Anaerolineae bacterium]